ncbi:exodeoxyribonuclease V beta chain [Gordonia araii NBRC 100433]|uniref:RecBCD enzyme subunit RecB n=1 Tax=Gordonia araii NBRC 100433 TaxID=1073574 RepID=G7H030_9ACTN|nr:UvrD-helicase domain-containing protein [Gordonia araii]NNG99061.1 UvrD-helicase domain-containing protein [Gordonia araii NBRC 100433]GAB09205.1 exodeoxyribonuclease V beta chain [Gordonia araii NBRC 100433]
MTPTPFTLADPLPTGTLVLEASAGTGKTYAIAALAVRFIAEGTPVSRLLMATFSNAASTELRDRTRARLRECADALADLDAARAGADPLIGLLADGETQEVALRRERLLAALSDFDAATMATTHTFCNRMLTVLGFLGERDQHYLLVEDVDDLARETGRDLYLKRFAGDPDPDFAFSTAEVVARDAVRNPTAVLAPADAASESGRTWVRFAQAVRERVRTRKRWSRLRTYDDLQGRLHEIITDDQWGAAACERIRDRYEVVLVDEFQDTDPEQWEILRRCFHGHRPMVLVGDPKQSIYAFRGAEVLSYLAAAHDADEQRDLTDNWRSDGPLVDALGAVLADAELGDPRIAVRPVRARHAESRLAGTSALRLRYFNRRDFTKHTQDGTTPLVGGVRDRIIDDVAADIAATLASGATILVDDGAGENERRIEPGDIAVLLRTNGTIEPLQRALGGYGIATVVTGGQSVFATDAARYWWYVLQALDKPSDARRVRLAALTPLLGVEPRDLDAGGDAGVGELAGDLARWARIFEDGGPAAMTSRLIADRTVAGRVLGLVDGERLLTDLLQLASLMGEHVAETGCGLSGLVTWLGESVADGAVAQQRRSSQTRRLDRDTAAVQLMTVHASKGLEFPIVYVPFGWDGVRPNRPKTFTFHDDRNVGHLDVGGERAPGHAERKRRAEAEAAGEELRLLYVALTRARSQVVAWWAPSTTTPGGAMHRVLFTALNRAAAARSGGRYPIPDAVPLTDDAGEEALLRDVAGLHPGITVEHAGTRPRPPRWRPPAPPAHGAALTVATFERDVDQTFRRTSYSAIVRAAHEAAHLGAVAEPETIVGSEPDDQVVRDGEVLDEPADDATTDTGPADEPPSGTPSLMNGLPFGARFGTLVHEVLENVDTSVPDRAAHVRELCEQGARRTAFDIDVEALSRALDGVLTTPIGFGDLWSVAPADRLSEMDFELPLADVGGGFDLASVAELMRRHLRDDDPLRPYADEVAGVSDERFHGYLTGSIDSVLRVRDGDTARFVVVDYKTNRIQPGDLVAEVFSTEAMAAEMMDAHYPLQALLYSVALHRYLRWRLPGYTPEQHLGPVQYHFVRGMVGPETPPGCGVFQWEVPAQLVVDLSDLLAGVRDD